MSSPSKIQLARLAYVHYEHEDLDAFREFAKDFGLIEAQVRDDQIFYRGYGKDPIVYIASRAKTGRSKAFKGACFVAKSLHDYELALRVEGATVIDTHGRPGGGLLVVIKDPNGYDMGVWWGLEENSVASGPLSSAIGDPTPVNGSMEKQRKGKTTPHLERRARLLKE
jgi:hypothetical protein